jgi:hypothetical protein
MGSPARRSRRSSSRCSCRVTLTSIAENAVGKSGRVHVLGVPIAPGSLFVYTVTASTVALVVLMPIVGAFADRTGRKRDIMLGCGCGCGCGCGWALACVAMVGVGRTAWQLGCGAVRAGVPRGENHIPIVVEFPCLLGCKPVQWLSARAGTRGQRWGRRAGAVPGGSTPAMNEAPTPRPGPVDGKQPPSYCVRTPSPYRMRPLARWAGHTHRVGSLWSSRP